MTVNGGTEADGIAIDSSGNAYVEGGTYSGNFPIVAGSLQLNNHGVENAFAAKLSPTGNTLVYGTYLGGSSFDRANAVAIETSGNAYITGLASSSNFPTRRSSVPTARRSSTRPIWEEAATANLLVEFFRGESGSEFAFVRVRQCVRSEVQPHRTVAALLNLPWRER